jgi:DNA-binding MarR family transcriptional regulator
MFLGLTDEGLRILEKIDVFMAGRIERIFQYMSPFERDTVVRSLGLLNEAISRAGKEDALQGGKIACCK